MLIRFYLFAAVFSALSSSSVVEAILESAAKLELDLPKPVSSMPKPPLSPIAKDFTSHHPSNYLATTSSHTTRPTNCQKRVKRQVSVQAIIQEAVCAICVIGAGTYVGAMMGQCIGSVVNRVVEELSGGHGRMSREEIDAHVQSMYRFIEQPPSADGSMVLALGKIERS